MIKTVIIAIALGIAAINIVVLYCACVMAGEADRRMNLK